MSLTHCTKQLLPLTYRTHYLDEQYQPHFMVWRQWLGRVFAIDDIAVQTSLDNSHITGPGYLAPPKVAARMPRLKIANDLWGDVMLGKRVTVRAGHRDIPLGPLLLESNLPDRCGEFLREIAEVVEVRHKLLRHLTELDADDDLQDDLRRFYPALTDDSEITLIYFIL